VIVVSSLLTIGGVLGASRLMSARGPGRVVPLAFGLSALITLSIWSFVHLAPRPAAVVLYVHMSLFGAILISWFWSLVTERFDPRTARRRIGRIAAGGTAGGLLGGIVAERVGALFPVAMMFPVLGILQAASALATYRLARAGTAPRSPSRSEEKVSGLRTLSRIPYLRNLALLVMIGTVAAVFLDYGFKHWATQEFQDGAELLRFFAVFYTAVAFLTFLIQSTLTRPSLENLGLSRTASFLPLLVGVGGVAALAIPGLAAAGSVRGLESAVRSSLFRSSYELFYAPISPHEKRASKTIVDVGFDRLGDVIGGLLIQGLLLVTSAASGILMAAAAVLGAVGFWLTRRLHHGYVTALESNLIGRAGDVETTPEEDAATRTTFLQTVAQMELSGTVPDMSTDTTTTALAAHDRETGRMKPTSGVTARAPSATIDPMLVAAAQLRSGDAVSVRRAMRSATPLPPELVSLVIPLLAWDEVASGALQSLRPAADRHCGQLLDSLLDPDEDFSIRRRIPRVLSSATTERAAEGLLLGLGDRRFEVRYQCGIALAKLTERRSEITVDRGAILEAVSREVHVDRRVWESQRLFDEQTPEDESPFFDAALRARSSRSLEHVFTMLSLVFPRRPLEIAYRGLYASDPNLRGTALEYLEVILPTEIREDLWPFLEDQRPSAVVSPKSREEALESLLRSHQSIQIDLAEIRKRAEDTS
jgi:AAA family ATP:ADP antiporter